MKLRTLLVNLLHYCAASQRYTGHNTAALADANLTATQLSWGTNTAQAYNSVLGITALAAGTPAASFEKVGLCLTNKVEIRYCFSAADIDGLSMNITVKNALYVIRSDEFIKVGDVYYVYFDSLDASQMSATVDAVFIKDEAEVSDTLHYSVESYAFAKQNDADTNLADLVNAMMKYGRSAYSFANKSSDEGGTWSPWIPL